MKATSQQPSLYERLRMGLEEGIQFARGEMSLRTTEAPRRPPAWSAEDVRRLRRRCRMSQAMFASVLNVSVKTVQSWEQGERRPSQAALRLLQVFSDNPSVIGQVLNGGTQGSRRSSGSRKRRIPV